MSACGVYTSGVKTSRHSLDCMAATAISTLTDIKYCEDTRPFGETLASLLVREPLLNARAFWLV
eukprot:1158153-Pelagomonas_calceolata.AAC.7